MELKKITKENIISIGVSYDTPFTNIKRKSFSNKNLTTYFLKSNQDSFKTIWN